MLNQKGLFKKEKDEDGNIKLILIKGLKTEEDYFNELGITYKKPNERDL
jgi:hypothetical protein